MTSEEIKDSVSMRDGLRRCGLVARRTDVSVEFLLITTPFCLVDVSPGNELLMALFGPSFALASLVLAVTFRAILRKRGRAAR